jgi:hypothetical protein
MTYDPKDHTGNLRRALKELGATADVRNIPTDLHAPTLAALLQVATTETTMAALEADDTTDAKQKIDAYAASYMNSISHFADAMGSSTVPTWLIHVNALARLQVGVQDSLPNDKAPPLAYAMRASHALAAICAEHILALFDDTSPVIHTDHEMATAASAIRDSIAAHLRAVSEAEGKN